MPWSLEVCIMLNFSNFLGIILDSMCTEESANTLTFGFTGIRLFTVALSLLANFAEFGIWALQNTLQADCMSKLSCVSALNPNWWCYMCWCVSCLDKMFMEAHLCLTFWQMWNWTGWYGCCASLTSTLSCSSAWTFFHVPIPLNSPWLSTAHNSPTVVQHYYSIYYKQSWCIRCFLFCGFC